ncbi:MAG: scpA [Parcubacteria group bacterium]|nr:scpA [Parcubacteria group bacterium]
MEKSRYAVKTPVFEGPLDLLLDLVEKRKLFVSDVSLAQVTDDFISYIETHEEFPIGESAEFIVIASTLMLVKSRSLLPQLQLTQEEETSIEDLEKRLTQYKKVKELSLELGKLFGKRVIFEKTPSRNETIVFSPDGKTTADHLLFSLRQVLASIPKKEVIPKALVRKMISLEETIEKLSERISKGARINFKDFAGKDKISIIVGFLAMLELVKRGAIRVTQEGSTIEMESEALTTPTYA